ncbi:shikimate dehydrogenase [Actinomyces gaoshouyii]|uniref:Shikimate 5-dehydrogenase n=1 Tax=Actinomyces gaoshouyii TaxID=1960083 RepID=A0A8H9HCT7_9ACTO|nr:shikimate dehydrogenase [Actinomyces gaoshouyii]ARD41653.1 shikimate dehydrogenase [Actinomyces gaoshouyii]GGO97974.1 shikimate 5-dehydrogenase [Actinomyces gaoshouyii]
MTRIDSPAGAPPASAHRAAVIGDPIAHSLSPVLHRAAYEGLGLADWSYEALRVAPGELVGLVDALRATVGEEPAWAGLSVTMPHKQAIMPMLDVIDPLAQAVGAVNTVVAQRSGAGPALLAGFNTDVAGISGALREARDLPGAAAAEGLKLPAPTALVLGSGATACSALAALPELGAHSITVAARRHAGPGRALVAAHRMGLEIRTLTWRPGEPASDAIVAEAVARADLVVSTLPRGAADTLAAPLARAHRVRGGARREAVLLDVVYAPWPTALARAWSGAGGAIAPGWLMLLHQAVAQVRLMTGRSPDTSAMRGALLSALDTR